VTEPSALPMSCFEPNVSEPANGDRLSRRECEGGQPTTERESCRISIRSSLHYECHSARTCNVERAGSHEPTSSIMIPAGKEDGPVAIVQSIDDVPRNLCVGR
jgi:hypothetical protein